VYSENSARRDLVRKAGKALKDLKSLRPEYIGEGIAASDEGRTVRVKRRQWIIKRKAIIEQETDTVQGIKRSWPRTWMRT